MIEKDHPSLQIRVHILGEWLVEIRQEDGTWKSLTSSSPAWGPRTYEMHTKALFGYLLTSRSRRSFRSTLLQTLWIEQPACVDDYLHRATSRLHKLLGDEKAFRVGTDRLRFELADQSRIWVDVSHCQELIAEAKRIGLTTKAGVALLEAAIPYFQRGPLLEEEPGRWAYGPRGEAQTLFSKCLRSLAKGYEALLQWEEVERVAESLLHDDATDEDALCSLMLALHQQGDTAGALRRYRATGTLLNQLGRRCARDTEIFAKQLQQATRIAPREPATMASLFAYPFAYNHVLSFLQTPQDLAQPLQNEMPSGMTPMVVAIFLSPSHFEGIIPWTQDSEKGKSNMDIERRALSNRLFQAGVVSALSPAFFGRTDVLERLVQAVKRSSFIDTTLLGELRSSVTNCWKLQPAIAGIVSFEHLGTVHMHLAYLTELLEAPLHTSVRQQLTSMTAECLHIIGGMYNSMRLPTVAERYLTTARTAAEEAGNLALKSVILGRMSVLPIDFARSLALLQEAIPLAQKHGTGTTYSWLQARKAEHLSVDAQYATESEKALALATTLSPHGDPEHDPYWTRFDESRMYQYQGSCYVSLGKLEAAKTASLQALQISDPHALIQQTDLQLDLASVYQQLGDIVNACLCGHRALSLISRTHMLNHLYDGIEGLRSNFPAGETDSALQAFDEHKMSVQELLRQQTHFEEMV